MPKRKDCNLSIFLDAANPDLVERYLLRFFRREQLSPYLMGMNQDYVLHVLGKIEELKDEGVVLNDYENIVKTINEI